MELCILLIILTSIAVYVREIIIAFKYKKYPLDKMIEMKINREYMNNNYKFLSKEEKDILEFTSDLKFSIYLTRRITNKLVITIIKENGEKKEWIVFENQKNPDKWMKYLRNDYFTKKNNLVKILIRAAKKN